MPNMPLRFPTPHSPAARFLYLRFVLAYVRCVQAGYDITWADQAAHSTSNTVWTAPGRYLRRSMLLALLRKLVHFDIPDSSYVNMTFEGGGDGTQRSNEDEEALAASLAARIMEMWGAMRPWTPKVGGLREKGADSEDSDDTPLD
jgi:hypothetical protein